MDGEEEKVCGSKPNARPRKIQPFVLQPRPKTKAIGIMASPFVTSQRADLQSSVSHRKLEQRRQKRSSQGWTGSESLRMKSARRQTHRLEVSAPGGEGRDEEGARMWGGGRRHKLAAVHCRRRRVTFKGRGRAATTSRPAGRRFSRK